VRQPKAATKMGLINWFSKSFTADKDGGSARKLSAFYAVVLMAGFITIKKADAANSLYMLIAWLVFAALCLGMVTAQQLIEWRNKKEDPDAGKKE
jgi:hypothetical protein